MILVLILPSMALVRSCTHLLPSNRKCSISDLFYGKKCIPQALQIIEAKSNKATLLCIINCLNIENTGH